MSYPFPPVQNVQVVVPRTRQSQALPALVNIFLPGVGQLIQGRIIAWLVFSGAYLLGIVLCCFVVGFFILPIVIVASVVDAAWYDPDAPTSPVAIATVCTALGAAILLPIAFFALGLATLGVTAASLPPAPARRPVQPAAEVVSGFSDYYVEIEQQNEIVMCQVTFRKLPPTADIAESVVRSAMQTAVKKHPNQEILGMAFNLDGDTLPHEQYGGPVTYKPSDKQILTMRERDGLKTTEQDQGEYFVQVEENKTATGITPVRRWLDVAIVFPKSPSENEASIAAVREIGKLKGRQLDVSVYIHTGEKSNKITWQQTPAPNGKFMAVEYDNSRGTITPNWNGGSDLSATEAEKPTPEPTPLPEPTPEPTLPPEPTPNPNLRTWTSGKFSVEAEFLSMTGGVVKLRRKDNGAEIKVPQNTLSEADRQWLDSRQR